MDILEAIDAVKRLSSQQTVNNPHFSRVLRGQYIEAQKTIEDIDAYSMLNLREAQEVAISALELFDVSLDKEFIYLPSLILKNLARIRPEALAGLYDRLLVSGSFRSSGLIFRGADSAIRDQLLKIAQEIPWKFRERKYKRIDILCALAWIGDERVQANFAQWIKNPPPWTKSPQLDLLRVLWAAGWELTSEERRDLYFQENYSLVLADSNTPDEPAQAVIESKELCGWCGRTLTILFDLNVRDSRLTFLWPGGERLRIATCINCSMQHGWLAERIFIDVDGKGFIHWSSENGPIPPGLRVNAIEEDGFALQNSSLVLGAVRKTPYDSQGNHLGGIADWIQDADYPLCPTCQRTMRFLGQIEPDAPYLEGTIYAFLCRECGKSTIGYQQT